MQGAGGTIGNWESEEEEEDGAANRKEGTTRHPICCYSESL